MSRDKENKNVTVEIGDGSSGNIIADKVVIKNKDNHKRKEGGGIGNTEGDHTVSADPEVLEAASGLKEVKHEGERNFNINYSGALVDRGNKREV